MGCELVHLVELACRGGQGDLEAGDLAEPVFASGLVDPGAQIVAISTRRGRAVGSGRSIGQRTQACSWMHGVA